MHPRIRRCIIRPASHRLLRRYVVVPRIGLCSVTRQSIVSIAREENRAMATQAPVTDQDTTVEHKIQKLKELFADAPPLGRAALQNVLKQIASDASNEPE